MVADTMPAAPPGGIGPEFRSPLEDVADMFWSFHRVALAAALEREPSDFGSLIDQAKAWEARNRRAFLVGYLATAGIGGLVPADREMVRNLVGVLELERAAERVRAQAIERRSARLSWLCQHERNASGHLDRWW